MLVPEDRDAAALIASLEHELKTPLTAVRVAVENLRDEPSSSSRAAQANVAVTELERLNQLFIDLLDVARVDAHAINIERQWVAPADIIDAATAHLKTAPTSHSLSIDANFETEVELDPRVTALALARVLRYAAQRSDPSDTLKIEARGAAGSLYIAVASHSFHLDRSELDEPLQLLHRHSGEPRKGGSVMDLSIARGLLAAVDGSISADDGEGDGTQLTIVVPGRVRPAGSFRGIDANSSGR